MLDKDALTPAEPSAARGFGDAAAKTVKMEDVAALAGVSIGTVSNTINHPEIVRLRTREAVERAIRDLGFVPNQQARVLTGLSSQVIGLVVLDVVSPFFMAVARAVERAASEAGHMVILCNSENSPDKEARLLQMLAAQRVRGVLLTSARPHGDQDRTWAHVQRPPVVLVDYAASDDDCSVAVDDVRGARLAVQHLLDLGHERIAFVGGPSGLRQMAQRVEGARAAIVEAGLDPSTAFTEVSTPGIGTPAGLLGAQRLIEAGVPTGVLCGNDMMAFGVFRGLVRAGLRVPDDVAVVGYDDIDFAADWVVPLTSVRQPTDELGYRAAQLLFEHSAGDPGHVHRQIVLEPELVVRQSTAPPTR
ncbi:MAG: LacI family transcriptional regulator [Propionibacteriaceae bacterium]|jgi:LacI family transcriptional regulator|nr:LacI family transcriptional regulator [Propionibacteriaceae bacterium]